MTKEITTQQAMRFEYCCQCGDATGRAVAGADSLYTEHDGPFCDGCFPECECDAPERPWVGLTPTDMEELSAEWWEPNENEMALIAWVEAKLKEKNFD